MGTISDAVKSQAIEGDVISRRIWLLDEVNECADELQRIRLYLENLYPETMSNIGFGKSTQAYKKLCMRSVFMDAATEFFDVVGCIAKWNLDEDEIRVVVQTVIETYDDELIEFIHSACMQGIDFVWEAEDVMFHGGQAYSHWKRKNEAKGREPISSQAISRAITQLGLEFSLLR